MGARGLGIRACVVLLAMIVFAACQSGDGKSSKAKKKDDSAEDEGDGKKGKKKSKKKKKKKGKKKKEGGDDDDDDAPEPAPAPKPATIEDGCADYAAASCERFEKCDHGFRLKYRWADAAACRTAQKAHCVDHVTATDANVTPEQVKSCAAEIKTIKCWQVYDELMAHKPPACRFKGTRPAKAKCATHAQCASGYCENYGSKGCGKCRPHIAEGEKCKGFSDCELGLRCYKKKCVKALPDGSACKGKQPCEYYSWCVGGKCTHQPEEGDKCDPDPDASLLTDKCGPGYRCDNAKRTCKPSPLVTEGRCQNFDRCVNGFCNQKTLKCQARAKAGEACSQERDCEEPLRCRDKKCQMPSKSCE